MSPEESIKEKMMMAVIGALETLQGMHDITSNVRTTALNSYTLTLRSLNKSKVPPKAISFLEVYGFTGDDLVSIAGKLFERNVMRLDQLLELSEAEIARIINRSTLPMGLRLLHQKFAAL